MVLMLRYGYKVGSVDKNANLLNQLFKVSQDVIYSISVDDGLLMFLSPTFSKLTGWKIKDWIGRPFVDIVYPEDRPVAYQAFADQIAGRDIQSCILRILTKSDKLLIGEFASSLILNKEGKAVEIVGIARDVTKRKMMEEELARRDRQVLHILDSITDGFYLVDNEWRYILANRTVERVLGKTQKELIGRVVWEEYSPEVKKMFKEKFEEARRSGKPVMFDQKSNYANEWFEIRIYPHSSGLAVYFTDITIRKRAEEQLKKHNEGVEKILADILGIQEKWGK